uniref:Non-specific serine/threonine protein kinase n=1 Tax=Panagrolaimus davidi TaxID=227884 RepID=A0A914Q1N2_9BILA
MASAAEILPEFLITKALSELPGENFLKLYDAAIVKGKYPQMLLNLFDDYKGKKYNQSPRKIDAESQTYLVLSLTLAGPEVEKVILKNTKEILSILAQVCFADAVAESVLEFEHRDQHVSNIFIETTEEPEIIVELNGTTFGIKTFGKLVRLADYGNSRLKLVNSIICKDLEKEGLFEEDDAITDLHQQVYLQINNGKDFTPKTSVLWLQYLIQKLTKYEGTNSSKFSKQPPKTDVKLTSRKEISKELCDGIAVLPNAQAVAKYFESHKLFEGIITQKV